MGGQTKWRGGMAAVAMAALLAFAGAAAVRNAQAAGAVMSIDPPSQNVATDGAPFTVNVKISGASNIAGWEFGIGFDGAKLEVSEVTEGPFLKSIGLPTFCIRNLDTTHLVDGAKKVIGDTAAAVQYSCFVGQSVGDHGQGTFTGASGDSVLATVTFKPKQAGVANLLFFKRVITDPSNTTNGSNPALDVTSTDGVVQVGATGGALQPTPTANAANLTPVALPPRENDPFVRGASQSGSSSTPSSGASSSSSAQSQPTAASGVAGDPSVYGPPAPAGGVLSANAAPAADTGPLSGGGDLATGGNGASGQAGSGFPRAGYGPQSSGPDPWWRRSGVSLFLLGALLLVAGVDRRRRRA